MRSGDHRDFPGRVALIALLRVGHVAGVVGLGSALLHGEPPTGAFPLLLVVAGLGIALLDSWSNRAYLRQVSGLAVVLKAGLLAALAALGALGSPAFWGLLVFSVVIAHAPGRVRHRRML
ncbi:MAG TPA: hypothetical protein VF816_05445 [Rhodocyclaceae bacterium]